MIKQKAEFWMELYKEIAGAQMALMTMVLLNSVLTVITLGFIFIFNKHFIFSSHKDGDYDSCFGSSETECKICNPLDHRTL